MSWAGKHRKANERPGPNIRRSNWPSGRPASEPDGATPLMNRWVTIKMLGLPTFPFFRSNTSMLEMDLAPAQEKNSRCLMIVLHGLGDSMEGYRWLPAALGLPWLHYLLVNGPDPYFGGYAWYDFSGD